MKRVVAVWTEAPFTSYERRSHRIEHRVLIEHYGGIGADVRHEVRLMDDDSVPDEWVECDVFELREHGIQAVAGRVEVPRE